MERIATTWQEHEALEIGSNVLSVRRGRLMQLVFEAGEREGWQNAAPEHAEVPVPVLRSVILYCLAAGIGSSEEIIDSSDSDPAIRYLCGNHHLSWQVVHEFRRRNSPMIIQSLATMFETVVAEQGSAISDAREEAQVRLRRAIQADSYVLDL